MVKPSNGCKDIRFSGLGLVFDVEMQRQTVPADVMHDIKAQRVKVGFALRGPRSAGLFGDVDGADVHRLAHARGGIRWFVQGVGDAMSAIGHRSDDHIERGEGFVMPPCHPDCEPNSRVDVGSVHPGDEGY